MINKKLLFVCMGNICRSPAAEGIMKKLADENLFMNLEIDSAGTLDYHSGEPADQRMIDYSSKRGYDISQHRARQFDPDSDFVKYDYILAMDKENFSEITALDESGRYKDKIFMITSFSEKYKGQEVPDPYFGGRKGFELVLDMLEDSCKGLIKKIENESNNKKEN